MTECISVYNMERETCHHRSIEASLDMENIQESNKATTIINEGDTKETPFNSNQQAENICDEESENSVSEKCEELVDTIHNTKNYDRQQENIDMKDLKIKDNECNNKVKELVVNTLQVSNKCDLLIPEDRKYVHVKLYESSSLNCRETTTSNTLLYSQQKIGQSQQQSSTSTGNRDVNNQMHNIIHIDLDRELDKGASTSQNNVQSKYVLGLVNASSHSSNVNNPSKHPQNFPQTSQTEKENDSIINMQQYFPNSKRNGELRINLESNLIHTDKMYEKVEFIESCQDSLKASLHEEPLQKLHTILCSSQPSIPTYIQLRNTEEDHSSERNESESDSPDNTNEECEVYHDKIIDKVRDNHMEQKNGDSKENSIIISDVSRGVTRSKEPEQMSFQSSGDLFINQCVHKIPCKNVQYNMSILPESKGTCRRKTDQIFYLENPQNLSLPTSRNKIKNDYLDQNKNCRLKYSSEWNKTKVGRNPDVAGLKRNDNECSETNKECSEILNSKRKSFSSSALCNMPHNKAQLIGNECILTGISDLLVTKSTSEEWANKILNFQSIKKIINTLHISDSDEEIIHNESVQSEISGASDTSATTDRQNKTEKNLAITSIASNNNNNMGCLKVSDKNTEHIRSSTSHMIDIPIQQEDKINETEIQINEIKRGICTGNSKDLQIFQKNLDANIDYKVCMFRKQIKRVHEIDDIMKIKEDNHVNETECIESNTECISVILSHTTGGYNDQEVPSDNIQNKLSSETDTVVLNIREKMINECEADSKMTNSVSTSDTEVSKNNKTHVPHSSSDEKYECNNVEEVSTQNSKRTGLSILDATSRSNMNENETNEFETNNNGISDNMMTDILKYNKPFPLNFTHTYNNIQKGPNRKLQCQMSEINEQENNIGMNEMQADKDEIEDNIYDSRIMCLESSETHIPFTFTNEEHGYKDVQEVPVGNIHTKEFNATDINITSKWMENNIQDNQVGDRGTKDNTNETSFFKNENTPKLADGNLQTIVPILLDTNITQNRQEINMKHDLKINSIENNDDVNISKTEHFGNNKKCSSSPSSYMNDLCICVQKEPDRNIQSTDCDSLEMSITSNRQGTQIHTPETDYNENKCSTGTHNNKIKFSENNGKYFYFPPVIENNYNAIQVLPDEYFQNNNFMSYIATMPDKQKNNMNKLQLDNNKMENFIHMDENETETCISHCSYHVIHNCNDTAVTLDQNIQNKEFATSKINITLTKNGKEVCELKCDQNKDKDNIGSTGNENESLENITFNFTPEYNSRNMPYQNIQGKEFTSETKIPSKEQEKINKNITSKENIIHLPENEGTNKIKDNIQNEIMWCTETNEKDSFLSLLSDTDNIQEVPNENSKIQEEILPLSFIYETVSNLEFNSVLHSGKEELYDAQPKTDSHNRELNKDITPSMQCNIKQKFRRNNVQSETVCYNSPVSLTNDSFSVHHDSSLENNLDSEIDMAIKKYESCMYKSKYVQTNITEMRDVQNVTVQTDIHSTINAYCIRCLNIDKQVNNYDLNDVYQNSNLKRNIEALNLESIVLFKKPKYSVCEQLQTKSENLEFLKMSNLMPEKTKPTAYFISDNEDGRSCTEEIKEPTELQAFSINLENDIQNIDQKVPDIGENSFRMGDMNQNELYLSNQNLKASSKYPNVFQWKSSQNLQEVRKNNDGKEDIHLIKKCSKRPIRIGLSRKAKLLPLHPHNGE